MNFQSASGYTVKNDRFRGFSVGRVRESNAHITTVTQTGATLAIAPVSQVIPGYVDDVFFSYYRDGDNWDTDINEGAMRWSGYKTTNEIKAALRKCGFTTAQITQVLDEAKGIRK